MLDLNGLLGRVLNAGGQILDTPGKRLAAGGAGAALLFTETGRDIAGAALKYGGIAALGGLAWHAWQKHKAAQAGGGDASAQPAPLAALAAPPPLPASFAPRDPAAQENLARLIVVAMVTAAKADGTVDSEEQGKILGHAEQLRLSDEEQGFLFAELGRPFDMEPVVQGARTPEVAAEVYAASAIAVGQPSPAEAHYLKRLAQRLQLPDGVVTEIHRVLGSAQAAAA
jgi:uncharacterized membrane protein YebE (DUF533 family)